MAADLSRVYKWACEWQLNLSISKCCILTIGKQDSAFQYTVNGIPLARTEEMRDLGFLINRKLNFSSHCTMVFKKASITSINIFRYFKTRNREFLLNMYKTFVRSQVETGTVVWSPYKKKDIALIEKIQRRYTKHIPGLYNETYESRLDILNLETLEKRRKINDLLFLHKTMHNKSGIKFEQFFEWVRNARFTRTNLKRNIAIKRSKSKIRENFFCLRVAKYWNQLDNTTQRLSNFNQFKKKIRSLEF